MRWLRQLFVLCLLVAAAGCSGAAEPERPWVSGDGLDHPLVGHVWHPASGALLTPDEAADRLQEARFILLGEKHDNADHHRIQAWLLRALLQRGRRPAVAFEAFTTAQQPAIERYVASRPGDASGLGEAVDWASSGWPAWAYYQPIAQEAMAAGAPILAASLPRPEIRTIARQGVAAVEPGVRRSLALDQGFSAPQAQSLTAQVVASHCNQLPASMTDAMVTVQRVKDAKMAATLVEGAALPGRDGAVLIAGLGHVRRDYAVPWHLAHLAPGQPAAVVAIVEAREDSRDPAEYASAFLVDPGPRDLLWFTPRATSEDPCERFAEQLRRAATRHGSTSDQ